MLVILAAFSIVSVALAFVGGQLVANGVVWGWAFLALGSGFLGILNAALYTVSHHA